MAKKIKVVRKKIKKPDEFLTFTDRALKYLNEHKNLAFGILGGVVGVLLIINLANYGLKSRRAKADQLLVEAFSILNTPLTSELTATSILKGAKSYSSSQQRAEEAIKKLNEVIKQFGGGEAVLEARFHLGEAYLEKGDYAQALSSYQDFLKRIPKPSGQSSWLEVPAYLGMAKAYYGLGDYKNAEEYYEKVIASKQDAYLAEATLAQARVWLKQGELDSVKLDRAKEKLNWLIQTYPGSIYDQLAKIELEAISKEKTSK